MKLILVYITCQDKEESEKISRQLLKNRLVACVNIVDSVHSLFFWPPKKNHIDETTEAVLLCHTLESKYKEIEKEVLRIHSYTNPALYAIPLSLVSKKYYNWLVDELQL